MLIKQKCRQLLARLQGDVVLRYPAIMGSVFRKNKEKGQYRPVKQLGISLLEVMLSISIIALILVMATRFFYVASNNNKVNTAISQVAGLLAAAHSWKGANLSYEGISISALFTAGELTNFPGAETEGNIQKLHTPWGGDSTYEITNTSDAATITATIPRSCILLQKAFGAQAACQGDVFTYTLDD